MDPLLIVSCDCHAGASPDEYRAHMDPSFREGYDAWRADRVGQDARVAQALGVRMAEIDPGDAGRGERRGPLSYHWNAERRLALLDADGIAAEVIFPQPAGDGGPPFYPFGQPADPKDPAQVDAGCRAWNRWIAEFVKHSPAPERHAGLALLGCFADVAACVREVEWAREAGLRGVVVRSQPFDAPPWNHPRYEPLWSACEALEMPVHTHGGETPEYGDLPGSRSIWFTEVCWHAHRLFWHLLWAGVLERHPRLRLVFTEQFADWVPDLLHQLDALHAGTVAGITRNAALSLRPSEIWARQCTLGGSFLTRRECERRHAIGVANLMWGSDFPHDEGVWPKTREALHATFDGVPEPELRAILGANALRLYGLDAARLREVARRVGPRPEEFVRAPGDAA
jgi:predicted TIM-barrel fold metal-dependent hydrolase